MWRTSLLIFLAGTSLALTRNEPPTEEEVNDFREFLEHSNDGEVLVPLVPGLEKLQNPWENSGKFQGDIMLNKEQREEIIKEFAGDKNAVIDPALLWPSRTVYWTIAPKFFNAQQIDIIEKAIAQLDADTCLTFKKRTTEANYVNITAWQSGCWSWIGMQKGQQELNLDTYNCVYHEVAIHEMVHALGFYHMHATYDRDDYVKVVWDNVRTNQEHNFYKKTTKEVSNLDVPYDYGSIMHYGEYVFSKNREKTLYATQPSNVTIGKALRLSAGDKARITKLYAC